MRCLLYVVFLFVLCFHVALANEKLLFDKTNESHLAYIENKGQVCDQNHKPRADVLFSITDGNMICHFKNNGISYQLSRIDSWKEQDKNITALYKQIKKVPDQITIYRLDVKWKNANTDVSIKKGLANTSYGNYYLEQCPDGVLNVKNYEEFTYQNMYDGIDLKWYQKDGHLKYDYLVSAGANYKKIQLEFKGAQKILISKNGDLVITTPLGDIIEQAPVVTQNGKILKARWVLKNNIVSYKIENINPNQSFVIDPLVRTWGTYYGGNGNTQTNACTTDKYGNVFMCGSTESNIANVIATTGSHQTMLNTGLNNTQDAFLVKFDSLGVRQWGTYYGGDGIDIAISCCADIFGNLFMVGSTASNTGTGINTQGSHQPNYGGGTYDAFLAKFNNAGVRQWATYYGGNNYEIGYSCNSDTSGNVYIAGTAEGYNNNEIATLSSHQPNNSGVYDAFLVKFNSAGIRQWGTYYGGLNTDYGFSCVTDINNNVYLAGITESAQATYISTPGSHQPNIWALTNNNDAFLVKFNSNGVRQWGTYYGGNDYESASACKTDLIGNVYLTGNTNSTIGMATNGSHQPVLSGGTSTSGGDAYLVKFNSAGVRVWGTYYGGTLEDDATTCEVDIVGNIYVSGSTRSTDFLSIATFGSYQSTYGGSADAFLVKFDSTGARQWGTYYGGYAIDAGYCTIYKDKIYLAGYTSTSGGTVIASVGSHQPIFFDLGGTGNAFLVQFYDCTISSPPANNTIPTNQTICANETTTLSVSGTGLTHWYNNSGGLSIGTGLSFTTPTLSAGTYTYYADASDCPISINSTAITVTVNALPAITVNSGTICSGDSFTITPTGAYSYSYSNGSVVTPTVSNTYTVIGESIQGCIENSISTVYVTQIPTLAITGNTITCATNSLILTATGVGSILWNTGETTPSITTTPTNNITYIATASNNCGNAVDSISIFVNPLPVVIVSNDTTMLIDNSVNLFANGGLGVTYSWLPSNIACSTCSTNIVAPINTTTYTVTVTNANGCSVIKNIVVTVESNLDVFVPDIFSPNGDGQNDILYVRGKGIKELSFKLYDRLGEKIFETNDVAKGWDGSYKGSVLNNAVFVYVLTATLIDGSKINKHGDVTLIR